MKIHLDRPKCAGHAHCYAVDSELFPIDDEGFSTLVDHVVPLDHVDVVRDGVASCPELALILDED